MFGGWPFSGSNFGVSPISGVETGFRGINRSRTSLAVFCAGEMSSGYVSAAAASYEKFSISKMGSRARLADISDLERSASDCYAMSLDLNAPAYQQKHAIRFSKIITEEDKIRNSSTARRARLYKYIMLEEGWPRASSRRGYYDSLSPCRQRLLFVD